VDGTPDAEEVDVAGISQKIVAIPLTKKLRRPDAFVRPLIGWKVTDRADLPTIG
jgi:hypothetical protein